MSVSYTQWLTAVIKYPFKTFVSNFLQLSAWWTQSEQPLLMACFSSRRDSHYQNCSSLLKTKLGSTEKWSDVRLAFWRVWIHSFIFIKHIFNSFYQNIYRKMETPEMKVIPILLKWKLWQQESDSGSQRRIISCHILDIFCVLTKDSVV